MQPEPNKKKIENTKFQSTKCETNPKHATNMKHEMRERKFILGRKTNDREK